MERSRSKRYYSDLDYESEILHSRSKPRFGNNSYGAGGGGPLHYGPPGHNRRSSSAVGGGGAGRKMPDPSMTVTTNFRILCHDVKAGGVIGKNGSAIKEIRQHTGASINVHDVIPGDEERIIEISDQRRRDPEGKMPSFSPAQEALFLIHGRILEIDLSSREDDHVYGSWGGGNRMATRMVVSRMHVGSLLGKGGKIIEQMKAETNTHIRILPRDQTLPRCVSMSEEIVQVIGDMNGVKSAVASISFRLRESQHRDRTNLNNRLNAPDDDFHGTRCSENNSYSSHSSQSGPDTYENLVFRILCPVDKIDRVIGESNGILNLLQNEIGVCVDVSDPVAGSDERIITVCSNEGPDDELFPAQEALLHIQTHIVDIVPERPNIITTRLLLQSDESCSLSDLDNISDADVEIRPRDIVQIVGEIKAARLALMEVTSRVRSYIYRETLEKIAPAPAPAPVPRVSASRSVETTVELEEGSRNNAEASVEMVKENESEPREDQPSGSNRISVPLVTRSILEVILPHAAASELVKKSKMLCLISERSGASVKLIDERAETTEKIVQISGTPEQAERAQSLLHGFILSTEEDGP